MAKRRWTAAERKAFADKMKRARAAKSGGAKRNPPKRRKRKMAASSAPKRRRAPAKRNPPKRKRRFFGRARRNPATPVITETLKAGGAALIGGLAAFAGLALLDKAVTDPTARAVGAVVVPVLVGIAATQVSSPHAQGVAAGAFGVAAIGLARSVSGAMLARVNPPSVPWVWENPPLPANRMIAGELPSAWSSPFRS